MTDEEQREPSRPLEPPQQVENLGLDRGVDRGRGLVGDEQIRIGRQGLRDEHPLSLAAAQLVRIRGKDPGCFRAESGLLQHAQPSATLVEKAAIAAMGAHDVPDLRSYAQHRVQRELGLLINHADARAADRLELSLWQAEQLSAVESDGSGDARLIGKKTEDGQRQGRLAGTGLSEEPDRLAARDRQADAVDGAGRM